MVAMDAAVGDRGLLDWHGWAKCHDCDWRFSAFGIESLDVDEMVKRHTKQTGHTPATGMHRVHFCDPDCEEMGVDA